MQRVTFFVFACLSALSLVYLMGLVRLVLGRRSGKLPPGPLPLPLIA